MRESDKQTDSWTLEHWRQNILSFWAGGREIIQGREGSTRIMILIFGMNRVYYSDDSAFETHRLVTDTHADIGQASTNLICLWSSQ